MARAESDPLTKHTLFLFEGDYEKLAELHPELKPAHIIRHLVRKHIERLQPPADVKNIPVTDDML